MHLRLLFSIIYFHVFQFICYYFMSIYIICVILLLLLLLLCIKCIYVSCILSNSIAELSSLYPYGVWRFGLRQTKQEKKHWVTKCHLEIFLNVVFMIHFVIHLFVIVCFFLIWCHRISSFSVNADFSVLIPQESQNTFPMVPWAYR